MVALALTGCASPPKQHLAQLNTDDPAYVSPACQAARQAAARYNDHIVERAGVGLVAGALGPFGLPIAGYSDAKANEQRKAMNAEVDRQCSTPGVTFNPKADRRDCSPSASGEEIICKPVS